MRALTIIFSLWLACFSQFLPAYADEPSIIPITFGKGEPSLKISLKKEGAYLLAPVKVNGTDVGYFLIDTGAEGTLIDSNICKKLNLPKVSKGTARGVGGTSAMTLKKIDTLSIGDLTLGEHEIAEVNLEELNSLLAKRGSSYQLIGLLGASLLSQCPFTLDYESSTITFYDRKSFQPPTKAHMATLSFSNGIPSVKVRISGKQEAWFGLDTGDAGAIDIGLPFSHQHPELLKKDNMSFYLSGGIGGLYVGLVGTLEYLEVFGEKLERVEAAFPRFQPLPREGLYRAGELGQKFLKEFRLTLDYQQKRLWAEKIIKPELQNKSQEEKVGSEGEEVEENFYKFTPLMAATGEGDLSQLEQLLDQGEDINATTLGDETALMFAAYIPDRENAAQLLIEKGADIHRKDRHGRTALRIAAECGQTELVHLLLGKGAKVNAADNNGTTILQQMVYFRDLAMVKLLLENSAKVDIRDQEKRTALMIAAGTDQPAIVQLLIETKANLNSQDSDGCTPLAIAVYKGHDKIVEMLIAAGANVNTKFDKDESPLMNAAFSGHIKIINLLLTAGADIESKNDKGQTSLMAAAYKGHLEAIQTLIAAGANINVRDQDDITPLAYAALNGHEKIVEELITAGADIHVKAQGVPMLTDVAAKGYVKIINILLKAGADVEAKNNKGWTPLMVAVHEGQFEAAQILIAAGANANAQANDNSTALSIAKEKGHAAIIQMLEKAGAHAQESPSQ